MEIQPEVYRCVFDIETCNLAPEKKNAYPHGMRRPTFLPKESMSRDCYVARCDYAILGAVAGYLFES